MNPACIETICLRNRQLQHLAYHEQRLHRTRTALGWGTDRWSLGPLLKVPAALGQGTYKCRLTYAQEVENVEWEPYVPRPIQSLRLVYDDTIKYPYKYFDRTALLRLFDQRGTCDDVLIVQKGYLTDTSYCNVALFDGTRWLTPATPLLPGTQRQYLLDQGVLSKAAIRVEDLRHFLQIRLFNAMLSWEEGPTLSTEQILR